MYGSHSVAPQYLKAVHSPFNYSCDWRSIISNNPHHSFHTALTVISKLHPISKKYCCEKKNGGEEQLKFEDNDYIDFQRLRRNKIISN